MKFAKLSAALAAALLLAGCGTTEERLRQQGVQDHAICQDWGLKKGTGKYTYCREMLMGARGMEQQRAANKLRVVDQVLQNAGAAMQAMVLP